MPLKASEVLNIHKKVMQSLSILDNGLLVRLEQMRTLFGVNFRTNTNYDRVYSSLISLQSSTVKDMGSIFGNKSHLELIFDNEERLLEYIAELEKIIKVVDNLTIGDIEASKMHEAYYDSLESLRDLKTALEEQVRDIPLKKQKETKEALEKLLICKKKAQQMIQENTAFMPDDNNSYDEVLDLPEEFNILYELENSIREYEQRLQKPQSLDIQSAREISSGIQQLSIELGFWENKLKTYNETQEKIDSLLNKVKIISSIIPEGNNDDLNNIISYRDTVRSVLENSQTYLWKDTKSRDVAIIQFISDVNLLEKRVKNYRTPLSKINIAMDNHDITQEMNSENISPNIVDAKTQDAKILSEMMHEIFSRHTKYLKSTKKSIFKPNKERIATIERVENKITDIRKDGNLNSKEKLQLIVGLLEANKDIVSHYQKNTDTLAKFSMRGIKKTSRLVSIYKEILEKSQNEYKINVKEAVEAFNTKYPQESAAMVIKNRH